MGSGQSKNSNIESGTLTKSAVEVKNEASPVVTNVADTATPGALKQQEQTSGCPMQRKDGSYSFDWFALFRSNFPHKPGGPSPLTEKQIEDSKKSTESESGGGCPVKHSPSPLKKEEGGCPVKGVEYNVYSQPLDPSNNMPHNPNQLPAPIQTAPLSVDRVPSSIPKGGAASENSTWTYPSPQMFYNALARKGKLGDTSEKDIDSVVALHNNMNEKTWRKVLEWEATIVGDDADNKPRSKLLRFQGKPTDLSPKAMFKHYVLGHPLPYDRHDWVVERPDGSVQRYVIDYYHDETRARDTPDTAMPEKDDDSATPSLLVDVRPALDGADALWHRVITMPYARHVANSTKFEPLPMQPTTDMKNQVQDSVAVWQSIQQMAAGKQTTNDEEIPKISESQAKELAKMFAAIKKDCKAAQAAIEKCDDEAACARASLDLTMCMGKTICPIQHQALTKVLTDDSGDSAVDDALTRISDCVTLQTQKHHIARDQHPTVFQ